MNDEFIKDAAGAESVDAYRKETRERLEKQAKEKGDAETENNIVRAIAANAEVEIPDAMIESQIDAMVRNAEYRMGMQYGGLKLADYLKYVGSNMDDFRNGYRAQAGENVKAQLVIDAIVRAENIKAEESEIEAKLEELAKAPARRSKSIRRTSPIRSASISPTTSWVNKLFDFLKENNNLAVAEEKPRKRRKRTRPTRRSDRRARPLNDKEIVWKIFE